MTKEGGRGLPRYLRSDNGGEFTAARVRGWLGALGVGTLFLEPGSSGKNGCLESLNGKLRPGPLNEETLHTRGEAQVSVEQWRKPHSQVRPHNPAPEHENRYHPPGQVTTTLV